MNKKKDDLEFFIDCKDYSVTGEEFSLLYDNHFDMLVTSPAPKREDLSRYYESEDYISHTDAKRSIFEKIYHLVKTYSLKKKVRLISKTNTGTGKLLDIGAGTGDFLLTAKKSGWEVFGTEPNLEARELAKQKNILLDIETDVYEKSSFDIITMWHVLEHVSDLNTQIKELERLLKPEGHLIIAVPNYRSYDAKHYQSFWAAYDVPRHLWHFSKKSIPSLFKNTAIHLIKILPMKFDAFYVSLLSEKYKTGKMRFINAFWVGFRSNIMAGISKEYSSHIYVMKKQKNNFK